MAGVDLVEDTADESMLNLVGAVGLSMLEDVFEPVRREEWVGLHMEMAE